MNTFKKGYLLKIRKAIFFHNSIFLFSSKTSKTKTFYSDIIQNTLYSDKNGYYSNANFSPIKKLKNRMNFKEITNINKYYLELESKYPIGSYSTAPEVLYPFFGFGVALYIEESVNKKVLNGINIDKIKITEIGAGLGGLAESILDYYKYYNSEFYSKIHYSAYERNINMSKSIKTLLNVNHSKKVEINENWMDKQVKPKFNLNASNNSSTNNKKDEVFNNEKDNQNNKSEMHFILLFNYLNSINHERLYIQNRKKLTELFTTSIQRNIVKYKYDSDKKQYCNFNTLKVVISETIKEIKDIFHNKSNSNILSICFYDNVKKIESRIDINELFHYDINKFEKIIEILTIDIFPYEEFYSYLLNSIEVYNKQNDFIIRIIDKIQRLIGRSYMWIPVDLSDTLRELDSRFNLSDNNIVIYDFDFLINNFRSDFKGINGPQIYQIMSESNKYKNLYGINQLIDTKEMTNIYFPVDFKLTKKMYTYITSKDLMHYKHSRFFAKYSLDEWFSDFSSFNALKETHLNSSFLCSI